LFGFNSFSIKRTADGTPETAKGRNITNDKPSGDENLEKQSATAQMTINLISGLLVTSINGAFMQKATAICEVTMSRIKEAIVDFNDRHS
jgi:hypothetical protein